MTRHRKLEYLWLVSWLTIAVALRLAYLDWGFPYTFHIDEESIVIFTQKLAASWQNQHRLINPSSSWGNLIFLTLGLVSQLFWFLKSAFPSEGLYLIFLGRLIAASLSFLGLGVIYLLARRLYNQSVALLSLAFNATLVVLIRAGHFYTLEVFLFFLVGLCLLMGEKISHTDKRSNYFWAFLFLGLALSSKVITIILILPLLYAHKQNCQNRRARFFNKRLLFALVALFTFLLLNPGMFQSYQSKEAVSTTNIFWVAKLQFGLVKPSWTLHFEGLPLFWYEISHNFWYGMGPFLELIMLGGIGFSLYRRRRADVYLLGWIIPYFLLIGGWRTKYIRYIVPLVPYGLILGAAFCEAIYQRLYRDWQRYLYGGVLGGGLVFTLLYAVAFTNVYAGPDSRIQAYRWAEGNIPRGSTLLLERDESLRLPFQKAGVKVIWCDRNDLYYKLNGEEKIPYLMERLIKADFLIVSQTNKDRYLHTPGLNPVEYLYYTLLDSGKLGFVKIKEFKVYPHIGPLQFDDDKAEQSFSLFDHPRVTIYQRIKDLPVESILFEELMQRFPAANF